jgi:hypothetical protein
LLHEAKWLSGRDEVAAQACLHRARVLATTAPALLARIDAAS